MLVKSPNDLPRLDSADIIGLDIETCDPNLRDEGNGVMRPGTFIAGIAVATKDQHWYIPLAHENDPNNLPMSSVRTWANAQLSTAIPKCGANLQYDVSYLWHHGFNVVGPFYDIQIAEPLIDETQFSYSLEVIAQKYLQQGKVEDKMMEYIHQHFKPLKNKEKSFIWRCPSSLVADYAGADAQLPIFILEHQQKEIAAQGLAEVWDLECRLLPILVKMKLNGCRVDIAAAEQKAMAWSAKIAELEALTNGINSKSSKQIAAELDRLGVEYPRHPPTVKMLEKGITLGNPKLDAEVLEELAPQVPLLQTIHELNKYRHFLSTFVIGGIVERHVNGRVHADFNQLKGDAGGTVTGRLSCKNPNLLNIPNPDNDPYFSLACRGFFLPESGHSWLRFDLSQFEYREIVHFASLLPGSGADFAVKMYREAPETDFHQMVADMMGVPRKPAKGINFGLCLAEGSLILTDKGEIPIENVTIQHRLWDGEEWVTHDGVIFTGEKEVITYDGVTATPGHIVFLEDGREVPLQYAKDNNERHMRALPKCTQKRETVNSKRLLEQNIRIHCGTMQRQTQPKLWGAWNRGKSFTRRIYTTLLTALQLRGSKNKEATVGQKRQQWTLRNKQPAAAFSHRQYAQFASCYQNSFSWCRVLFSVGSHGSIEQGVSCYKDVVQTFTKKNSYGKLEQRKDSCFQTRNEPKLQRVFDIVNAGPRNRFTCN